MNRFKVWGIDEERWLEDERPFYLSHDGELIVPTTYDGKWHVASAEGFARIVRCSGISAKKSYRGEEPDDLMIYEGDIVNSINVDMEFEAYYDIGKGSWLVRNIYDPNYYMWLGLCPDEFEIIGNINEKHKYEK